ncbi:unnamed protein product [Ilex paraguariensis]|uniref:RING-type E3 ubiquitin transferase n=1 Tax=Ilex paraguariensis TaxID=185542 RepID=A0ABC8UVA3_9AQUA
MEVFIFFICFSLIFHTEAFNGNCPSVNCGHGTPDIRTPFYLQDQQSNSCARPGFNLVCRENQTIVQFQSYGDLVVKSISYDIKKMDLLDPKNCVHEVFLNLNLSSTPFKYYYDVKKYTYLNCSLRLSSSFLQVPCLSGSDYHVYVVDSSLPIPVSCKPVKTIAIPFAYSPYISDNSFGLGLTWDSIDSGDCKAKRVLGITIFIVTVAILIRVKAYRFKKLEEEKQKKKENQGEFQVDKFLDDYETLRPARC